MKISTVDLLEEIAKKLVNLSNVLRLRRNELKLSQANVATDVGCDPATYNRWENNPDDIRFGDLVKIARVLKTTVVDMLVSSDEKQVNEPLEIYGLRDRVSRLESELDLYKKLCDAKESLLEKYREDGDKRKAS